MRNRSWVSERELTRLVVRSLVLTRSVILSFLPSLGRKLLFVFPLTNAQLWRSKHFNIELLEVIFGCRVTNMHLRRLHDVTGCWYLIVNRIVICLVYCVKMAAKFEFSISENYGYVDSFEKVERIIRYHELDTTTKYALFKSPKDFSRKGKAIQRICGYRGYLHTEI